MSSDSVSQTSKDRHRSRRRHRSAFEKWRQRIRTSKTARRRFIGNLVIGALVFIAFVLGFYAIGPIASFSWKK